MSTRLINHPALLCFLLVICGTVCWSQPIVRSPRTEVYLRVTGTSSMTALIESKLSSFVKEVPGVVLIEDPVRAKYVLDVNVVQIREQKSYAPVIAVSVVTLKTYPRLPFAQFVVDRWGELGPLGLLRAFIRKDHLVTLSTHRLFTTSTKRVTQTCQDIIMEFDESHIQSEFKATEWVSAVVNEAATTASLAMKHLKKIGERTASSAASGASGHK